MSKHLSFSLPVKLFLLSLFLPVLSWGQCVDPADLVDNTLEICQGEVVTFCPEVDEYCWKWLPESAFPSTEETMNTQPTTIPLEEDVVIQLIKTSNEGDLIEESEINVVMKSPDFTVELEEVYEFCPGGNVTISPVIEGATGNLAYEWSNGETTENITVSPDDTEIYELSVTDVESTGCSRNAFALVSVREIPDFEISSSKPFICQEEVPVIAPPLDDACDTDQYIELSVELDEGYSYSWTDELTNTVISTEQTVTVDFAGTYSVVVTDTELGCTATDSYEVLNCASVEIGASVEIQGGILQYQLEAYAGSGYTFEWQDEAGTTGNILLTTEPGDYKVIAISPQGCKVSTTYRVELPCKIPATGGGIPTGGGYVYTLGETGLLVEGLTPVDFRGETGKMSALFDTENSKLHKGQFPDLPGQFNGYLTADVPANIYNNGDLIEGVQTIYQGIVEYNEESSTCYCYLYTVNVQGEQVFGTEDGTTNDGGTPKELDFSFPPISPFLDKILSTEISQAPASACIDPDPGGGLTNNDIIDLLMEQAVYKPFNESTLLDDFEDGINYVEDNGYRAGFYYYDRFNQILRVYRGGTVEEFTDPAAIQFRLEGLYAGNLPDGIDYVGLYDRVNSQGSTVRFEPIFARGSMVPAVGDWKVRSEYEYQRVAKSALRTIFSRLSNAHAPVYGTDGQLESAEPGSQEGELKAEGNLSFMKLFAFGADQLIYITKNAQTDPAIWDSSDPAIYNTKPLHIWASAAGIGDQSMAELKDLLELVDLIGKVLDKPSIAADLIEGLWNTSPEEIFNFVVTEITNQFDLLNEDSPKGQRQRAMAGTKGVVTMTKFGLSGGTAAGGAILLDMVNSLRKFFKLIRKFDNPAVSDKLRDLSHLTARKFADDFGDLSDVELTNLVSKFDGNPNLIDGWAEALRRKLPDAWRKDSDFLESFVKVLNQKPEIDLHLAGHIDAGRAVGCHLRSAIDGINVRIRPTQPPGFPKYYPDGVTLRRVAIDIKAPNGVDWIPKLPKSTLFPKGWDANKVLNEIAQVTSKMSNQVGLRAWEGLASDGFTKIRVEYTGLINNLMFSTAFPI